MIRAFRLQPSHEGRRHRCRRVIRPAAEPLEDRAVPAGSITATFDGLAVPATEVTLPQPPSNGEQLVSLTLRASSAIPTLFRDAASGKILKSVAITLDQIGNTTKDTITLTSALIASVKVVNNPSANLPTYVVTVEGRTTPAGSITATFDDLTAPVINVTLMPPLASGAQKVSLTLAASSAIPTLFQDSVTGKPITTAEIGLVNDGNSVTDTVTLKDALITSFQTLGGVTGLPTYVVTLESAGVPTPPPPTATATFDGVSAPVLGVVLAPPSSGVQQATFTLGLSAVDLPLVLDAILGRPIKNVVIVQTQADGSMVTTTLTDALITSIRIVEDPSGRAELVLSLEGQVPTNPTT